MTALHSACLTGNIKSVDLLLDSPNSDFTKKDKVSFQQRLFYIEKLYPTTLCHCERLSKTYKASIDKKAIFNLTEEISLYSRPSIALILDASHVFSCLEWKLENN